MKVLIIVARKYNGHELWTSLGILKQRGHKFEVISTEHIIMDEITFRPNKIDRLVGDPSLSSSQQQLTGEFDALSIISGNMSDTELYWKDPRVLSYVNEFNERDRPIAAICCSVPTIRNAARDKHVSFFPLLRSRELLKQAGAILETVAMTRDQNLVTAEHQMATQIQMEEFCNLLEGKPQEHFLKDSKFTPQGRERMPIPALEAIKKGLGRPPTPLRSDLK